MLTGSEIDGFKTFEGFGLDPKPLTAIVRQNAGVKSNLFAALGPSLFWRNMTFVRLCKICVVNPKNCFDRPRS